MKQTGVEETYRNLHSFFFQVLVFVKTINKKKKEKNIKNDLNHTEIIWSEDFVLVKQVEHTSVPSKLIIHQILAKKD